MKKGLLRRYLDLRETWEDYPFDEVVVGIVAAFAVMCFFGYLMKGLDTPLPPLDSVTRVEVTSTEHEVSRIYEDEFGITKCYAHLKFNTQYKLWFPKEEKRPLTVVVTHGNGEDLAVQIGETTLSFDGKTFPLKQGEEGEALDDLTEHLLLKES